MEKINAVGVQGQLTLTGLTSQHRVWALKSDVEEGRVTAEKQSGSSLLINFPEGLSEHGYLVWGSDRTLWPKVEEEYHLILGKRPLWAYQTQAGAYGYMEYFYEVLKPAWVKALVWAWDQWEGEPEFPGKALLSELIARYSAWKAGDDKAPRIAQQRLWDFIAAHELPTTLFPRGPQAPNPFIVIQAVREYYRKNGKFRIGRYQGDDELSLAELLERSGVDPAIFNPQLTVKQTFSIIW